MMPKMFAYGLEVYKYLFLFIIIVFSFLGCRNNSELFSEISGKKLGIDFINSVQQNELINILSFELLYNGAGVAIDDFNNDGHQDLFFTGNIVENKLYINKGNLKFVDISNHAGIGAEGKWCSGVTTVDINNDGLRDIYVCATLSGIEESRKNMLFINLGPDEQGYVRFEDQAEQYGVDDKGHSTQAVFFDYDRDNDLDLYILTNQIEVRSPSKYYFKRTDGTAPNTDRFYRNNGDGTFSNYSREAGILTEGYGNGITVFDVNNDQWLDIYVSNDFLTNDILYVNNQDGTFSNQISSLVKHQSYFSMGCDIADINNDGLEDLLTLDRSSRDMQRFKRMWPGGQYSITTNNEKLGYDFQYMRNVLQVNQGSDTNGNVHFSDLSFKSGLEASDWSWSVLLNDYDADGDKDIFISNGVAKDIMDLDFIAFRGQTSLLNKKALLEALPESKNPNYLFENKGHLEFRNVSKSWGIKKGSFSNGAAYGDLDNDGDLDIVINNINDHPTFLINNAVDINYLKIELVDDTGGAKVMGSAIEIYISDSLKTGRLMPVRGYLSSVQPMVYFGLGRYNFVDSMSIRWADGTVQHVGKVMGNQTLRIIYNGIPEAEKKIIREPEFEDVSSRLSFHHRELRFNDFNIEPLLPRQYSLMGPSVSIGDVDNNGEQDIIVGGSLHETTTILTSKNGIYQSAFLEELDPQLFHEDTGMLLFDADNDGDQDLYIVSGGNEDKANTATYADRFYLNDGGGNYIRTHTSIPTLVTSGSCVKGADYDRDGDIDLFVGGRIYPGQYPRPVTSYLLRNDSRGKDDVVFTNINKEFFTDLIDIGMVSDAVWADWNNDGWMDLVLVGEWMSPKFFKNVEGRFENVSSTSGINDRTGWWNCIVSGDFDNDGDTDFICGNQGLNSIYKGTLKQPLQIFAKDFDENGGWDAFLASSQGNISGNLHPFHPWDDVVKQMVFLRKRVLKYKDYAKSTITDLFTPEELEGALNYSANWFSSSYIENLGNGQFKIEELPFDAQIAPIQSMLTFDVNDDNFLDVILVGNNFGGELFAGRSDAFNGLVLYGDGRGHFSPENYSHTGFLVSGDARALASFTSHDGSVHFIVSQNRDDLKMFSVTDERKSIPLHSLDTWGTFTFNDGSQRRIELTYGHSANSQSSKHLILPFQFKTLKIFGSDGRTRFTLEN